MADFVGIVEIHIIDEAGGLCDAVESFLDLGK